MSRGLLALVFVAAALPTLAAGAGVTAAPHDAFAAIDACIAQLDTAVDVSYAHVAARCPELAATLAASPYAAWLPHDWNRADNRLSASGLVELRELLARESAPVPEGHAPRLEQLRAVLAGLAQPAEQPAGWWERFKRWLRTVLTPTPSEVQGGWWQRIFGDMVPQAVLRMITLVAFGLVIALAVAVVINELRLSGVFRRRRPRVPTGVATAAAADVTLTDIERAPAAEQPVLLLQLIAARLVRQRRLPPADALTVRELTGLARLPAEADRERLADLAAASERLRFADREPPPQMLADALARGRELLRALELLPSNAAGAS